MVLYCRDRAILEHQISQLHSELDHLKTDSDTSIRSIKDKATRDVDSIRAELKLQKVQTKTHETQKQQLVDKLQTLQTTFTERETSIQEVIRVATAFQKTDERLVEILRTSSMGASLSLSPSTAPNVDVDSNKSGGYSETIRTLAAYDLEAFEDIMLRTMKLVKKWQLKCSE